ncbi:enoyl-ACP reductase FabI [Herbaspirillum seropedicae]|uniref:enoyl-ACP reductase FabI n=1 Tax=Herbaspirillum seropedicae TaxID=964 RepID=UPI003FCE846A
MICSLEGKRGLIVGIADKHSIAWGCARALRAAGADLAVTWLNESARRYVEPLADQVQASIMCGLDVTHPGEMEQVFDLIRTHWGSLDFVLHSIAFAPAPDLHGRVTNCSSQGFSLAMDVSCHSFIRMARLAEPLMKNGGSLLTMSYIGAEEVVVNYGVMGPVKAALESAVRYLAMELGPAGIRVNAVSPGPLATRAASGLNCFEQFLTDAARRSPLRRLANIDDVGDMCSFLVSDAASVITGNTLYVDAGYHIVA